MKTTRKPPTKKHSDKRKRNLVLRCRVLPTEAEQIRLRADALGVSLSEMLRESALDEPIRRPRKPLPTPDRQALALLTGQLGKVGSNLNQLAYHANREKSLVDSAASLSVAIGECRGLIAKLTEILK